MLEPQSPYIRLLKDRINIEEVPFSERGSRILLQHSSSGFNFRLAERWLKRDHRLAAYRARVPIIEGFQFCDQNGVPLEVQITTYPHRVDCITRIGCFTFTFVDIETVMVILPQHRCGIKFQANLDQYSTDRRGGVLHLTGNIRRNIAYTTNAHLVDNQVRVLSEGIPEMFLSLDPKQGQSLLINITPRLGFNRSVPGDPHAVLELIEKQWHDWFAAAPKVMNEIDTSYYYAWWIMRDGLISTRFYTTREAMAPSKQYYVGVWQWDAYFHALAYRHVDMDLAKNQLRIMLDNQCEDGMIPDAIHDEGTVIHLDLPVDADVTKPPLIAWTAWKLFQQDGDKEFLNEIYEPLVRWNRWWLEKNDIDHDGLCEYMHPFSSGMDDSPLWDSGMPVTSPDLNTYLFLQQESLAKIAHIIGERMDILTWKKNAQTLSKRMTEKLWDEETGYFLSYKKSERINIRTIASFLPLMTGDLAKNISQRLVNNLTDPKQFWAEYPLATVAMDEVKFDAEQMWRGPSWINMNYLLIEGLFRSGYSTVARRLRDCTLKMVASQPDMYEYYNPSTGQKPPKASTTFGWSAALFIDLAIQTANDLEHHSALSEKELIFSKSSSNKIYRSNTLE
jgi:putative isomerase